MADTRCVNPEYQLDVDVMILEYLLYQATRAQFDALKAKDQNGQHNTESHYHNVSERQADRLIYGFDAFIQIFKQNHREHTLDAGTDFNLTLFEPIVLLKAARALSPLISIHNRTNDAVLSIPDSMRQQWIEEQTDFLKGRRQWMCHQENLHQRSDNSKSGVSGQSTMAEMGLAWRNFQDTRIIPNQSETIAPLFSVLHRFMTLSAELAPVTGEINEKWMKLALQLMLQSALELLSSAEQSNPALSISEAPNTYTDGHSRAIPGLTDCFAFGFLPTPPDIPLDLSETEHLINNMFASPASTSTSTATQPPPLPNPNPTWQSQHSEALLEFHPPSLSSPTAFRDRLSRLRHKYPYDPFETSLLRCLEHFWTLNCSDDVSGKPVLVQIEEGRLEGLESGDFEGFLETVGLAKVERERGMRMGEGEGETEMEIEEFLRRVGL